MASLTAKANTGAGTDALAGVTTPDGFAGAVTLVDDTGAAINAGNPAPVTFDAIKAEDSPHVSGDPGLPVFGIRQTSDTVSADTDGDYTLLKIDEEGRLKVATKPASIVAVTGTATAVGNVIVADVRRASNVVFHVKNTGSVTLAAGTFVFEASIDSTDGTDGTWFGIQACRSNANTIETQIALSGITAGAGYAASWEASVNAYSWFRLRCSVAVTASAVATWTIQRGSYATEPIPAAQATATQAVSGTVTATVTPPAPTTPYFLNSAASTNGALIITGTSGLHAFYATNTGASAAFVKLYNKATAPTVGTDVPEMIIPVPAAVSGVPGAAELRPGFIAYRFALGLGIAITGGAADNDTTAVAAGQVKVKLSRAT